MGVPSVTKTGSTRNANKINLSRYNPTQTMIMIIRPTGRYRDVEYYLDELKKSQKHSICKLNYKPKRDKCDEYRDALGNRLQNEAIPNIRSRRKDLPKGCLENLRFHRRMEHPFEKSSTSTVHYLRQYHFNRMTGPFVALSIGEYQDHLVRKLWAMNIRHVFDEGKTDKISPASIRAYAEYEAIKKSFPKNKFPLDLNPRQKILLYIHGAALVYAVLRGNVTIHATSTHEIQKKAVSIDDERSRCTNNCDELRKRHFHFIMTERERHTREKVMAFLRNASGEKVALIFGATHSFIDQFKNTGLRLITHSFPRATYDIKRAYQKDFDCSLKTPSLLPTLKLKLPTFTISTSRPTKK